MKTPSLRVVVSLVSVLVASGAFAQAVPVSNYGYNVASQLTGTTEPNGQTHVFEYNEFGEMSRHHQPNPTGSGTVSQVDYGYNGRGQVSTVTDPRNLVTAYSLDGFGQASTLTSPDTGVSTASYDEAGNPTLKADARSKTGSLAFDALDRPISVSYSGSSVTFGYDAGFGVGKLTSMTDSSGSTAWTYDKLGRVTQKAQTTGAVTLTTGYTYMAGGRVATMAYPSGAVVGFTYDGANVTSITVNGVTVVSGVTYFPFGGPKGWTMGSIGAYTRQMDAHGRITSHTSEYGTRTLTWDASSRLTNIAETGQAARAYTYDNLNRLVTASEAASRGYAYDLTGNRTGETVNGTPYTYSVDSSSNRLSSSANDVHSRTYAFDAAGNTTGDGARTFTYDDVGQLASVSSSGGAAQYGYNGAGQRVSKTTASGAKYYTYAEDGLSLAGEYGAAGAAATVVETVYMNGLPVLALKGGAVYYVLPDHLATPRAIKDSAGTVVWRWSSDAFGNGVANESPTGGAQFAFNQRFPGQQFDAETGLYYNNARYYDPLVGRYITSDPIGLSGGLNTYAYVNGGPTGRIDPSGLEIAYANHRVLADVYHSKIVITPTNQAAYAKDTRFQNFNSKGQRYATLGAGPEGWLRLVARPNRDLDVTKPNNDLIVLQIPCEYVNEDEAITQLFGLLEKYSRNTVLYDFFPQTILGTRTGHNSNSFISGLGAAAGFTMPRPQDIRSYVPGYELPLYQKRFGVNK